jgi:hypothetical protein
MNLMDQRRINSGPQQQTCGICGLVARNKDELEDHVNHAHRQEQSNNSKEQISPEQKIDPFPKT